MITRAEKLEDAHKTLSPEPLVSSEEFDAFYRREINDLRGTDVVARLALGLHRSWGAAPFKALLMGHSGVGKSTEMTRLIKRLQGKFEAIRFSITDQLDPVGFQPFDVLLLMVIEVAERTAMPVLEGGAGMAPSDLRLQEIWNWYAEEKEILRRTVETGASAGAGLGPAADSWWSKALGLFGSVKGEMKYATVREREVVNYRLSRLDALIKATNNLLAECNRHLRQTRGCEWLFVGEDFDKAGIPPDRAETLFVTYSNVLRDLDAHLVFSIPITLGYSPKAVQLPVRQDLVMCIPDAMVFHPDHSPHTRGRAAVRAVLEARLDPALFEDDQLDRLVVASGGNLRELFTLANAAADSALLRSAKLIAPHDVNTAISGLRTDYERRLGESPYDIEWRRGEKGERMTYQMKAERLLRIYEQEPTARVPDAVLYSLLRARAVQEFDTERWFGVHPLVVDILAAQGKINRSANGHVPGGTE